MFVSMGRWLWGVGSSYEWRKGLRGRLEGCWIGVEGYGVRGGEGAMRRLGVGQDKDHRGRA